MGSATTYSSQTAAALLDLIDVAGGDLSNVRLPNVAPTNLNAVTVFDSPGLQTGGGRGVLAAGKLAGIDDPVAVLAISINWAGFNTFFLQSYLTTADTPPASLQLQSQLISDKKLAQVALGYALMFSNLRRKVWTALDDLDRVPGFDQSYPLIVVGMGPSAPVAQMIAAELRPGQNNPNGPEGAKSKVTAVSSYAFSCANYGNDNYAAGLAKAVPASFVANLNALDFYPSPTGAPADWVASGAAQAISAKVPATDAPWLERSPAFYHTAFGGKPPALPGGGSLAAPLPAGFEADLAYTLSTLGLIAYARFQHPNLGVSPPLPGGYALSADVKVNNVLWGTVFATLGKVVVALRGPCTWVESLAFNLQGALMPFPGDGMGRVLTGLTGSYQDLHGTLAATLAGIPGIAQSELYFTGHDFGGSLATMLGYAQKKTPIAGVPVTSAVYGFGTNRFCDQVFASTLANELSGKCFQIIRPADVIAKNAGLNLLAAPPVQVSLSGGSAAPAGSTTGHTLALYNALLNPRVMSAPRPSPGAVAPNALQLSLLPARAEPPQGIEDAAPLSEMMTRMTGFYGIDPAHLSGPALDTADFNGWLSLSGNPTASHPAPAQICVKGPATYVSRSIKVRSGQNLVIASADGRPVTVIASSIHIEKGGKLTVSTNAQIVANTLSSDAGAVPTISVVGNDGVDGRPGMDGHAGVAGMSPSGGHAGSPGAGGDNGSDGGPGANGTCPARLTFRIGDITCDFIVEYVKGNGGMGGNGGAGGAGGTGTPGGNGGEGGNGGNGGNGATPGPQVWIFYRTKAPGATFTLKPLGGRGGDPGQGGAGGPGATTGAGGVPGAFGVPGSPATVTLQQDPDL